MAREGKMVAALHGNDGGAAGRRGSSRWAVGSRRCHRQSATILKRPHGRFLLLSVVPLGSAGPKGRFLLGDSGETAGRRGSSWWAVGSRRCHRQSATIPKRLHGRFLLLSVVPLGSATLTGELPLLKAWSSCGPLRPACATLWLAAATLAFSISRLGVVGM